MIDAAELRALIRDVIATELAAAKGKPGVAPAAPAEHRVRIAGDADLTAFAKHVLALAADPAIHRAIAVGSYGFKLEAAAPSPGTAPPPRSSASSGGTPPAGAATRIDQGVVTETALTKLPRGTTRLQIGAGVSVTPLARDRARNLGITIERMKP